jgi:PKD repeat protein
MKRKNIIIITVCIISIIILSILSYSMINTEIFSDNKDKRSGNPEVFIIADLPKGNAPLMVNFESILSDFDNDAKYNWDFGDGISSNEKNPNHIYIMEGIYNCSLTVKDELFESSDSLLITVNKNNPPFIKIIVDKTSGNRPLSVNFDVDGFDTDGEIISYEWEIKYPPFFSYQKIKTYNEKNFSERFLRPGFYEVKLNVEDDFGNIASDYIKIQVLGHKIELLAGTILYYLGIFDTLFDILKNIVDKIGFYPNQNFAEKIISLLEAK